jgi:hypothetical protein
MTVEPFKKVLQDVIKDAMENRPPSFPSIISEIVKTCKITAQNEHEAMVAAMRIRQELYAAYVKAKDAFSKPCITVAVFKEVGDVEKDSWQVIAREMRRVG